MSGAEFSPQPPPRPSSKVVSRQSSAPGIDPAVWEAILRRTMNGGDGEDRLEPQEMAVLSDVAARHRGVPFGVEPVLRELVEAVLKTQFGAAFQSTPLARAMATEIAQTLHEDPRCCERLRLLWRRLTEESA